MTDTNLPLFSQNEPDKKSLNSGELLNFTTAVAGLVSAAIFYVAGWVYEANWYGFYGVSLTQVNLQPQQVMIEGIPGILLIIFSVFAALVYFSLTKKSLISKGALLNESRFDIFPQITLYSFFGTAVAFWVFAIYKSDFLSPIPFEMAISGVGMAAVILVTFFLTLFQNLSAKSDLFAATFSILIAEIFKRMDFMADYRLPISLAIALILKNVFDITISKSTKLNAWIRRLEASAREFANTFFRSWKSWIGIILLFELFTSVGLSAFLGRIDALYGRRLMMGGWRMNEIYIYSGNPDLPLPFSPNPKIATNYVYGPFGLIANDDQAYYLVEWKVDEYYESRPNLYVLPRSNGTYPSILYVPQPTQTPTPIPSSTPTPITTPTHISITPLVTVSPTP